MNKQIKAFLSTTSLPAYYVLFTDCLITLTGGYLGLYLATTGDYFAGHFWPITWGLLISLATYVVGFSLFHTYRGIVRYSSFYDLRQVFFAVVFGGTATVAASFIFNYLCSRYSILFLSSHIEFIKPSAIAVQIAISISLMWSIRIAVKILFEYLGSSGNCKGAFIYGVRDGGIALAKSIRNTEKPNFKLLGFISPEEESDFSYLLGVKVLPFNDQVINKMIQAGATALLVSPKQTTKFLKQQEFIDKLASANIQIFMTHDIESWDGESEISHSSLKEVEIEDLLPRQEIKINMEAISRELQNQVILITGAAGSIGCEIVNQVAGFGPSSLVLIDQAETPMHDLRLLVAKKFPDVDIKTIVGSITDDGFMRKIFEQHKPNYVFHAAAYKHVPMMEDNPSIAILNNVRGTRIIADLAVEFNAKKFVMISTDKAVNPTNVMGCSKRICEIYCQSLNNAIASGSVKGVTQFITTRFGNVLGSNGSVIPLFKKQIREGGPITVTDPNIIRYFMLIPEACKLVLEAGVIGNGGEIFVFDMGEPVKIVDLAKRMISLSGAQNIEIEFTGLRDGEKLYEEILADKEQTKPTFNPQIFIASTREYDYKLACQNEDRLLAAAQKSDNLSIIRLMQEIVPEYQSTNEKYKF